MSTATARGGATYQEFWPTSVDLNRARAARGAVAHAAVVRLGVALVAWGRRPRRGAGREPYLTAHEDRVALVAAARHDGLPLL